MGFHTAWRGRLWLFLLVMLPLPSAPDPELPDDLHLGNLPDTSFSCEGKVVGGYYADVETKCQMFHVCTLGSKGETQDIKFLCLQGTVFDQETRVCERAEEVVCGDSEQYYDLNKQLYQQPNHAHTELADNGTDSAGQASAASLLLQLDESHSRRAPAHLSVDDYSDDLSGRTATTGRGTATRAEVPLFSPRRTETRAQPAQQSHSDNLRPFSRFRQTRRFTAPTTSSPSPARVPLIPSSGDRDGPRLVVTNGEPFVPRLDQPDPEPAKQKTEALPSLALPETNFTCQSKVSGGHYADPETDCKMFHICVMGPDGTITDYKFLCGSSTVFDQRTRTCQETDKVNCAASADNYFVNNHLIVPTAAPEQDAGDLQARQSEYTDYYDYYFDYPEYREFEDP